MSAQTRSGFSVYGRLLTYVKPYKWILALSILGMVITAAAQAGTAAIMKPLLDNGFIGKDPEVIRLLPLAIVALFLVHGIGSFSAQYSLAWIGRKIIFNMRNLLFTHMMHLPTSYYDRNASGVLIAKIIYDVEQIANAATQAIFVLVKDSLFVLGLLAWMLYLNWKMTLVFLVVIPVLVFFVTTISHRFRKTSQRIQHSIGDISTVTQEATEGHRIVKAFGAQETEIETFHASNEKNRKHVTRQATIAAANVPVLELLAAVGMSFVIYYALKESAAGTITAGAFTSYFAAMLMMMNPAKRLTKVNEILQRGIAASQSVFDLLDEQVEENSGSVKLDQIKGRIDYVNVGFTYPHSTEPALHNISFAVEPGQTVALVGMSGSGKTTTVNLLPRFYNVSQGEILLDGVNTKEIELNNLRSHIALVSQETILFNDTIRNNIVYGGTDTGDENRLLEAAKAAHVLEFVQQMADGFDTIVGEKGTLLSGGQRQRIAIARALYKNAPILILDEATSSLDSESERYVQEAMKSLMAHRSTLVIAHRLSTVENADKIIVMGRGRVIEEGPHDELLKRGGTYATLYRNQFQDKNN